MPDRATLDLRARAVGIDPTVAPYLNDSVLEQRVLQQEKTATTVAGALASSTLTSTGVLATDGDTITIGSRTYTLKTALTEATASGTITLTAQPAVNDTVTIGTQTYRFVSTLAIPNDVLIGAANTNTAANLQLAITNGGTAGVNYANGTTVNPQVTASVSTNIVTISARSPGVFGNGLTFTANSANAVLSNGGILTGGVDPVANQILIGAAASNTMTNVARALDQASGKGTLFSSNTAKNLDVTPGTVTATTVPVSATQASVSNAATTKVSATLSWTGGTLAGGSPAVKAPSSLATDIAAVSGAAAV